MRWSLNLLLVCVLKQLFFMAAFILHVIAFGALLIRKSVSALASAVLCMIERCVVRYLKKFMLWFGYICKVVAI